MKVEKTMQVHQCDVCGKTELYMSTHCLGCGKDFCYECRQSKGVEYKHGVFFSGSGDGYYCHPCDERLAGDDLHKAYDRIKSLCAEHEEVGKALEKKREAAEANLKTILKARGLW